MSVPNESAEHDPQGVLMLGSVPLSSATTVFRKLCEALPGRLEAIPDGEVGERDTFILWQLAKLPPAALQPKFGGKPSETRPKFTLDDFKPTEYDKAAIASYQEFLKLREEGLISPKVRFQVGLPTPLNVILVFCQPEYQEEIEQLYLRRYEESLEAIVREIPSHDLVIQLETSVDLVAIEYDEGGFPDSEFKPFWSPVRQGFIDRIVHICQKIPKEVPVAFHLCYGDYRHKHWVEPKDTGLVVELINDIFSALGKSHHIQWFHVAVPRDRVDRAYFEPLNKLRIDDTKMYLGLVHPNDENGTRERIAVAQSVFGHSFGVATECGLGRTPAEEIDSILAISKAVTRPW